MASGSGSGSSPTAAADNDSDSGGFAMSEQRLRKTPLWRHVKVLETHGVLGGNAKSKCLYCGSIIPGSYSRVKAHLLRETGKGTAICNAATPEMVAQFRAEEAVECSHACAAPSNTIWATSYFRKEEEAIGHCRELSQ
jgi:hypothetical protein